MQWSGALCTPQRVNKNTAALLYVLGALIALSLLLPEWLTVPISSGAQRHYTYAGLWCMDVPFRGWIRWDDMRVDLDIYGLGYAAFGLGLVAVGHIVAVATGRMHLAARARKLVLALLVTEALFVVRLLIENGVGFYVLAAVGPALAYAAFHVLRKLAR